MGGQPVKKILVNTWGFSTLQTGVRILHNESRFSLNREGATAFAVFLLSLFAGIRYKDILGVGCRSPPASLNSKKFRLEAAIYEQEQTGHDVLPTPKRGNTF